MRTTKEKGYQKVWMKVLKKLLLLGLYLIYAVRKAKRAKISNLKICRFINNFFEFKSFNLILKIIFNGLKIANFQ